MKINNIKLVCLIVLCAMCFVSCGYSLEALSRQRCNTIKTWDQCAIAPQCIHTRAWNIDSQGKSTETWLCSRKSIHNIQEMPHQQVHSR